MDVTSFHWVSFFSLVGVILIVDLWRFYRSPHAISIKEASLTSIGWISLALTFNVWIYTDYGPQPALEFFTGYLLELSLSVDNLFVFLLLFSHFKVPETAKHQVLFYGVLGAIIMRTLLIWGGISLVAKFSWIFIFFGLFLVITGLGLLRKTDKGSDPKDGFLYRWISRHIPLTPDYHGESFVIKRDGKYMGTPLLVVLIMIEFTDLVFALDSVPAILGITTDPFIVFTSNIFAILGLRALFFVLEGMMKTFYLLHYALAFILTFIGMKMIFIQWFHVPTWVTLSLLSSSLLISIVASLYWPKTDKKID